MQKLDKLTVILVKSYPDVFVGRNEKYAISKKKKFISSFKCNVFKIVKIMSGWMFGSHIFPPSPNLALFVKNVDDPEIQSQVFALTSHSWDQTKPSKNVL